MLICQGLLMRGNKLSIECMIFRSISMILMAMPRIIWARFTNRRLIRLPTIQPQPITLRGQGQGSSCQWIWMRNVPRSIRFLSGTNRHASSRPYVYTIIDFGYLPCLVIWTAHGCGLLIFQPSSSHMEKLLSLLPVFVFFSLVLPPGPLCLINSTCLS